MVQLFQPATEFTCYYLELTNPVVRNYIFNEGKEFNDHIKMRKFIEYYMNMRAHRAMRSWLEFVYLRKRAREIATEAFTQLITGKLEYAVAKWRQVAMYQVAVLEIQRVVRGHFGRKRALAKFETVRAVTLIQKLYREHNFFGKYLKRVREYSRLAIKIQVSRDSSSSQTCDSCA